MAHAPREEETAAHWWALTERAYPPMYLRDGDGLGGWRRTDSGDLSGHTFSWRLSGTCADAVSGLSVHDRRARDGGSCWWRDQRLWRVGAARDTVDGEVVAMIVAIVRGGVSGSAWLVACRLSAWLQRPAPARALPCGCRSPVRLASADRLSLASAGRSG